MGIVSFQDESWQWITSPAKSVAFSNGGYQMTVDAQPGLDWWITPASTQCDGNAYCRLIEPTDDFTASVTIQGQYTLRFDQSTMFLIVELKDGTTRWVKAGVEREDDKNFIGSVVTTKWSDWSITTPSTPILGPEDTITFKLERHGHELWIRAYSKDPTVPEYRRDVNGFFHPAEDITSIKCGIMSSQPDKTAQQGVSTVYSNFTIDRVA